MHFGAWFTVLLKQLSADIREREREREGGWQRNIPFLIRQVMGVDEVRIFPKAS